MQDPKQDVKEVIERLVCRPTREEQGETLYTFFTPDVRFYHFYLNIEGGSRKDLTAVYQMLDFLLNYQSVQFYNIVYDAEANAVAVHMRVFVRPWLSFYREHALVIFTLLELEDHTTLDGNIVKLIKVQRDFFNRSPAISLMPIIGLLYTSIWLRAIVSHMIVWVLRFLKFVYQVFHPYKVLDMFFEANRRGAKRPF